MLNVMIGFLVGRWMQETGQKIENLERWVAQGGWRMEQGMPRELEKLLQMKQFCQDYRFIYPDSYWENPPLTQEDVDSPYLPMYMLAVRYLDADHMNRALLLADNVANRWATKAQLKHLIRYVTVAVMAIRDGLWPFSYAYTGMFSGLKGIHTLMKYTQQNWKVIPDACRKFHPVLVGAFYTHEIWKHASALPKMKDLACAIGMGLDHRNFSHNDWDQWCIGLDEYNYVPWVGRRRYVSEQGDTFTRMMTYSGEIHWTVYEPVWTVLDGNLSKPLLSSLKLYYELCGEWGKTVERIKECLRQYVFHSMKSMWYVRGEGRKYFEKKFRKMNLDDMEIEKLDFPKKEIFCKVHSMGEFIINFTKNRLVVCDSPWNMDLETEEIWL